MRGAITNSRPCVITPTPAGPGSYQGVIGLAEQRWREQEMTDDPNEQ